MIRGVFNRNLNYFRRLYCTKKMSRTAIVRCLDSEDFLTLSFAYDNAELGIKERQYNFRRNKTENLQSVKARILTNIERIGTKKLKKKRGDDSKTIPKEDSNLNLPITVSKDDIAFTDDTACHTALTEQGATLRIGDIVYNLKLNPPMFKSVILPTNIMAGFYVYPKVDVEFAEKSDCFYTWYRSTNKVVDSRSKKQSSTSEKKVDKLIMNPAKDWEKVGDHLWYVTSVDDIGHQLRVVCEPRLPSGESGLQVEAKSTVPVSPGPGICPFDRRHEFTKTPTLPGRLRMVSYNILADLYADSDFSRENLFPSCPPYALNIDYRKQLLLKEISGYNADVICLQEVDKKVFDGDLQPAFSSQGMNGILDLKGGQVAEGLACIYRSSKFKVSDHHSIVLAEAIQTCPLYSKILEVVTQNEKLQDRLLKRTTALQVVTLESVENPNLYICIANTHLYFHPDADHIRLLQAGVCLMHLEQVVALLKLKKPNCEVAVAFCGDFNSTPEFGVYQLLISQYIPEDHMDWSSNAEEIVKGLSLSHHFNMKSACGTPSYTNFTSGFVGCLDYIFTEDGKLEVEQVIPMPTDEEVKQHTAIPSVTMPSDHIALVCDIIETLCLV